MNLYKILNELIIYTALLQKLYGNTIHAAEFYAQRYSLNKFTSTKMRLESLKAFSFLVILRFPVKSNLIKKLFKVPSNIN